MSKDDVYGGFDPEHFEKQLNYLFGDTNYKINLRFSNIQYDLDGDGTDSRFERKYSDRYNGKTKQEVLSTPPKEMNLVLPLTLVMDGLKDVDSRERGEREDWIQEEIEDCGSWLVIGFDYEWMGMTFRFLDSSHHCVVFNKIMKFRGKIKRS